MTKKKTTQKEWTDEDIIKISDLKTTNKEYHTLDVKGLFVDDGRVLLLGKKDVMKKSEYYKRLTEKGLSSFKRERPTTIECKQQLPYYDEDEPGLYDYGDAYGFESGIRIGKGYLDHIIKTNKKLGEKVPPRFYTRKKDNEPFPVIIHGKDFTWITMPKVMQRSKLTKEKEIKINDFIDKKSQSKEELLKELRDLGVPEKWYDKNSTKESMVCGIFEKRRENEKLLKEKKQ
jgi:hypothetical protein